MADLYFRPVSDGAATGNWKASSGASLFAMLDESVRDDSDYVISGADPGADVFWVKLSSAGTPAGGEDHFVRYSFKRVGAATTLDLHVALYQGYQGTEIASWSHTGVGTAYVEAEQQLSAGEISAISDYTDLYLRVEANSLVTPVEHNIQTNTSSATPGTTETAITSYAVGTETDVVLWFVVSMERFFEGQTINGANFGATAMTEVGNVIVGTAPNQQELRVFRVINPGNVTENITVDYAQSLNADQPRCYTAFYTDNTDQTTPEEGWTTASDAGGAVTSLSVNVTTAGAKRKIIAAISLGDTDTLTPDAGQTVISNLSPGTSEGGVSYEDQASAGTYPVGYSWTANAFRAVLAGFAIRPS